MRGNEIIVSANPRGVPEEGTIYSALKPGRIVAIRAASGLGVDGHPVYDDANVGTDGYDGACCVLLNDDLQGVVSTTAYEAGKKAKFYYPAIGEDLNLQLGETAGTGNSVAYGDLLMLDADTGVLVAISGSPSGPIFQAMEALTQVVAGTLLWVKRIN